MLDPLSPKAFDTDPAFQRITLASLAYVRDLVRITGGEGDLVEALVFTTALDANMAPVDRDADLAVLYGRLEESAPDELRRPVSMNAVAQSLGLPFETVRRRFVALVERGLCVTTPAGVVIPRSAVMSESYIALQQERYDRTRDLFLELWRGGVVADPSPDVEPAADPLIRAVNRIVSEYALRICPALVTLTGSVLTSLVLLQLVMENIEGVDPEDLGAWVRTPHDYARPRRIVDLTAGLTLSRETVRRHLQLLENAGFCHRGSHGCVATPPRSVLPQLHRMAEANDADLRRMLARIDRLGVSHLWVSEA
ncbi:DeoR family transcriptional regulator [Caulobacter segnis]|uniref:DeoR family transcriptional regulator n=1 Tax=Caulobacter segnis TaxID=88688 RepID=UPI00240EBE6F|nr:DeoR family transcriptional regulator [Caulobacter segnis]MDG2520317.1 DeoR family transcriptional regulator [Caulobacter segnis]